MTTSTKIRFLLFLALMIGNGHTIDYSELQNILSDDLIADKDRYFFFMVPVEKTDDELKVEVGQFQNVSSTYSRLSSVLFDNGTEMRNDDYGVDFNDIVAGFSSVEEAEEIQTDTNFNFQTPVIVPLHFTFEYNTDDSPALPVCTEDLRTWQERVVEKVFSQFEIQSPIGTEEDGSVIFMRVKRDELAATPKGNYQDLSAVNDILFKIQELQTLSDIYFNEVMSSITELNSGHVAIISEGWYTYYLLQQQTDAAEQFLSNLQGDTFADMLMAMVQLKKPEIDSTFTAFNDAMFRLDQLE